MDPPIEDFLRYAEEGGLVLDDFGRCLGDSRIDQRLREERSAGIGLGVRSTPSFFVNGDLVPGIDGLTGKVKKILATSSES